MKTRSGLSFENGKSTRFVNSELFHYAHHVDMVHLKYGILTKLRGCFTDGESLEIVCDYFHSCKANIGEALLCMGRNDF
ncbi:hypothetical protein YDYSG_14610 [Paenibacillus tyrfis]|nr:hypothetical protein YDYSG_14610 [Paenibacillus tyrfis]